MATRGVTAPAAATTTLSISEKTGSLHSKSQVQQQIEKHLPSSSQKVPTLSLSGRECSPIVFDGDDSLILSPLESSDVTTETDESSDASSLVLSSLELEDIEAMPTSVSGIDDPIVTVETTAEKTSQVGLTTLFKTIPALKHLVQPMAIGAFEPSILFTYKDQADFAGSLEKSLKNEFMSMRTSTTDQHRPQATTKTIAAAAGRINAQ